MSELQTLESIINNAPEGATHYVTGADDYFRAVKDSLKLFSTCNLWDSLNKKWCDMGDMYVSDLISVRALSDIEKQIKQLKDIKHFKILSNNLGFLYEKNLNRVKFLKEQLASANSKLKILN
jgi:hypothetical protein